MTFTLNGYEVLPVISDEWVKQLVYDYIDAELDFHAMRVYRTGFEHERHITFPLLHGMRKVKAIVEPTIPVGYFSGIYADRCEYEEEIIDLDALVDYKNKEYHLIGYGRKSNKVFIGELVNVKDRIDIS